MSKPEIGQRKTICRTREMIYSLINPVHWSWIARMGERGEAPMRGFFILGKGLCHNLYREFRFGHGLALTAAIILLNSLSTLALKSDSIWYTSVNSAKAQRPYCPVWFTPGIQ